LNAILKKQARKLIGVYKKKDLGKFIKYKNSINLCSGAILLPDYCNIDISINADLVLDLENSNIPFPDNSTEAVICISAINYFDYKRGAEIVKDVYRILKKGGIARFASQDLEIIARKYIERDEAFFFEKNANGEDRFIGKTMADKFNSWFYGYESAENKHCKYVYDYDSLSQLFIEAGFSKVEKKAYLESALDNIQQIDNRAGQMFFLEAVK